MNKVNHIPELDGLRGFLAWWVVVDHVLMACGFSDATLPHWVRLLVRGEYPVEVFIILSGFVIFKLLHDGHESYRAFITRRFLRLFPAFIACLALALLMRPLIWSNLQHTHFGDPVMQATALKNWNDESAGLGKHLLAHLTLLHGAVPETLLPGSAIALLAPAWSISLEWQFYLVAPFLYALLTRWRSWGTLLFFCVVIPAAYLCDDTLQGPYPMPAFLPRMLPYFGIGIATFFLRANRVRGKIADWIAVGVAPLLLVFTLNLPLAIWCAALAATMADGECHAAGAIRRWLNSGPMQKIGTISYSTYLVHICCIWPLLWLIQLARPAATQMETLALLLPSSFAATYFVSVWMHRFVEMPGIRLGRNLAKG